MSSPHKSPCHAQWILSATVPATDKIQDVDFFHYVHLQEKTMRVLQPGFFGLVCCTDLKETAWRNVITLKANSILVTWTCLGLFSGTDTICHGVAPIWNSVTSVNYLLEWSLAHGISWAIPGNCLEEHHFVQDKMMLGTLLTIKQCKCFLCTLTASVYHIASLN